MNRNRLGMTFAVAAAMLVSVCLLRARSAQSQTRSPQSSSRTASPAGAKTLLLEKNEGERRIWREPPPGDFILKVSPKNNGSQHLVMLTEDMPPGGEIEAHRHLAQDEILYIVNGTVHAHVGDQERDLHAGATVFIPANTWVNIKNVGTETVSLVGVFSAPGFEDYMRCDSVLPNEKVVPLSLQQQNACAHLGHVMYRDLEPNPKK